MKILVAGDSVIWGQGLENDQKFHILAARQIAEGLAIDPAELEIIFQAHSGATIKAPAAGTPPDSSIPHWQEVPFDQPTIIGQVQLACANTPDPDMHLVILNGGINDVDFRRIINPTASDDELELWIEQHCYYDMLGLLQETRRLYPKAVIIVAGYYPILSELSNLQILTVFVSLLSLKFGLLGPLLSPLVARRSVRRTRYFYRRQLSWLRRAVSEMQSAAEHSTPGMLFAHPTFGDHNCVGAPQSFLFQPQSIRESVWKQFLGDPLANFHRLIAIDPMAEYRRAASTALIKNDPLKLITALVASIGHPNAEGAQRYAQAVSEKYLNHYYFTQEEVFAHFEGSRSIRTIAGRYGLASVVHNLSDLYHYWEIDCIDITVSTAHADWAGTDHHIYLRVRPDRQWRLNETLFEGDLYNDFEPGQTTTYSIDPTDGHPDNRLYLWELEEISLVLQVATPGLITEPIASWQPERVMVAINGYTILDRRGEQTLNYLNNCWTVQVFPRE